MHDSRDCSLTPTLNVMAISFLKVDLLSHALALRRPSAEHCCICIRPGRQQTDLIRVSVGFDHVWPPQYTHHGHACHKRDLVYPNPLENSLPKTEIRFVQSPSPPQRPRNTRNTSALSEIFAVVPTRPRKYGAWQRLQARAARCAEEVAFKGVGGQYVSRRIVSDARERWSPRATSQ